jgi:hypothetical protein
MNSTGPSLGILNAPLGLNPVSLQQFTSDNHSTNVHLPDLSEENVDDEPPEQQEQII